MLYWYQTNMKMRLIMESTCFFTYRNALVNFLAIFTAWKLFKYGFISGPYFLAFGLNTESYSVSLRIQSECVKIRTKNNSVFGHFSYSDCKMQIKWSNFIQVPASLAFAAISEFWFSGFSRLTIYKLIASYTLI